MGSGRRASITQLARVKRNGVGLQARENKVELDQSLYTATTEAGDLISHFSLMFWNTNVIHVL